MMNENSMKTPYLCRPYQCVRVNEEKVRTKKLENNN